MSYVSTGFAELVMPVVLVDKPKPVNSPRRYSLVGNAARYVFGDIIVTARHILGDKVGGEFTVDQRISVIEGGKNGEIGDSPIESVYVHESHDIAAGLLGESSSHVDRRQSGLVPATQPAKPGDRIRVYHYQCSAFGNPVKEPPAGDKKRIHTAPSFLTGDEYQELTLSISMSEGRVLKHLPDGWMAGPVESYEVKFDSAMPSGVSGAPVVVDSGHILGVVSMSTQGEMEGTVTAIPAVRSLLVDEESTTIDDLVEQRARGLKTS